jgi:hypothetical protein
VEKTSKNALRGDAGALQGVVVCSKNQAETVNICLYRAVPQLISRAVSFILPFFPAHSLQIP